MAVASVLKHDTIVIAVRSLMVWGSFHSRLDCACSQVGRSMPEQTRTQHACILFRLAHPHVHGFVRADRCAKVLQAH